MAETAKALGLGQKITFEGVDYRIAAPEYGYLGEFELWLENRALQKVERQRGRIPEDVYKARHDTMVARVGAGTYERGQPEFQKAMESHEGLQELMWCLMEPVNPGIERSLMTRMFSEAYADMLARVALAVKEIRGAEVPNAPAQAESETTSPSAPSAQSW